MLHYDLIHNWEKADVCNLVGRKSGPSFEASAPAGLRRDGVHGVQELGHHHPRPQNSGFLNPGHAGARRAPRAELLSFAVVSFRSYP